jgi:hypothetical protein
MFLFCSCAKNYFLFIRDRQKEVLLVRHFMLKSLEFIILRKSLKDIETTHKNYETI